jgi:hypothetical protein
LKIVQIQRALLPIARDVRKFAHERLTEGGAAPVDRDDLFELAGGKL